MNQDVMQWILIVMGVLQLIQAVFLTIAASAWRLIWGELMTLRKNQESMARDLNRVLGAHEGRIK